MHKPNGSSISFSKASGLNMTQIPTYLSITLDRSLTYCDHMKKTAAKVSSRNNLLSKLAGTSWGARAQTLKTTALALCYSAAEYCAPVWSRSSHTRLVDVQLNTSMHIITGTLHSTPGLRLQTLQYPTKFHCGSVCFSV